ncbi:MAG TPA: alpha/beta hydrolase [Acidimicrobiia bacterium]|jgi:pimeloyl-ACP methyl ester carboxylesterase
MPRRLFACFVALASMTGAFATLATATAATPATAAPAADAPAAEASPTGLSAWRACGSKLQCATLTVPVDYTQPDGEQVDIAVARLRATSPASPASSASSAEPVQHLGSLVFNFGGPGDAGTGTLPGYAAQIPAAVRARYDLVSFDPRGTGKSRPVECIDDATADRLNAVDPTPSSDADLQAFYDDTHEPVDLVARCVARNGAWLAQLGSRNVARDLDRLRAALGEDTLSFVGYSYGTVIGSVYAQMFPDRVGRMVLDSPVDLSANALDELRGNAQGFEQALEDFLADCAGNSHCSFHSGGDPTSALANLQRRFERGLELPTVDVSTGATSKRKTGVAAFYTALISALYDRQYGWPELADALDRARGGDGSYLLALADLYNGRRDDGSYDNIDQVIGVILCDDRDDPMESFDDYRAEYDREVAQYPLLGAYVGSSVLGCDPRLPRPPATEQVGDVHVTGSAPILVVGTTRDPATPFAGAQDLVTRLAGSRLLTFDSTEHTAYSKNACIDRAVNAYLLRGTLPPAGTVCTA